MGQHSQCATFAMAQSATPMDVLGSYLVTFDNVDIDHRYLSAAQYRLSIPGHHT